MKNLQKIKRMIGQAQVIVVGCHINPDGDTIGSMLSLALGLEKIGKTVFMLSQDEVPHKFVNLPGAERIRHSLERKTLLRHRPDLAISVDCSTKELLGKSYKVFQEATTIVEIDHHEFRRPFGDIALIDDNAAAVGEIIYELLRSLRIPVSKDIAQNILTSIIVETNSFRLPNVRAKTFALCAELMKSGVDFYHLSEVVYWSKGRESELLIGLCISRCQFMQKGKIVWSMIWESDFSKMQGKDEDVDSVASEMLAIKGVEVSVFFREKKHHRLRVSLRSKGAVNVAQVAEAFGGGGHYDVAGCVLDNTEDERQRVLAAVKAKLA